MHHKENRRRRARKSTVLDIMKNERLTERLNLYMTRNEKRQNTIQTNSFILNNNYQPLNNQNDEEGEKLLFK